VAAFRVEATIGTDSPVAGLTAAFMRTTLMAAASAPVDSTGADFMEAGAGN